MLDIQGVGEYNDLLVRDTLAIIELSHHLDEICRVTGILTNARVYLGETLVSVDLAGSCIGLW